MIRRFLSDYPDQWDKIRADASLIPNAVEEAVRLATPIRAFTRYAIEDVEVSGHVIPKGKRVIVCYASANRDARKYDNPDDFDVTRDVHDHLGFGQGVHMCMGMHLARREMILLLEALRRRVERFELLDSPEVAMNTTIRAYSKLPVRVHLSETVLVDSSAPTTSKSHWLDIKILSAKQVATDILGLELTGEDLPTYEAGAHVDVRIKSNLIRQYSLTGDPADRSKYRLGILLDPKSRGGSSTIHADFKAGKSIKISHPRNNFPLQKAMHTILFAGGIGITPMLGMAYALHAQGESWELHYCGRTAERLAFRDEMAQFGGKVHLHLDDGPESQLLDFNAVLAGPVPDRHLYVCGPNGFMDFVISAAQVNAWSDACIHLERFGAEVDTDGAAFTVVAAASGKTFEVAPGETIADKLSDSGIEVALSCQSGVCGTCLTRVIEGTPDHRDLVQTDIEKATNAQITLCCSRSKTRKLVLDI